MELINSFSLSNTFWYVGQIIFIVAVCALILLIAIALLATLKLCVQLCGLLNTLVLSPTIYVYNKGNELYDAFNNSKPPYLDLEEV